METFNLQVRIPPRSRDALKAIAALRGITLRQLLNESIEQIIADAEETHGLKLSRPEHPAQGRD